MWPTRYEVLREAVSGTMSSFQAVRDRQTDQIVGLKVLDKEKTEQLEMRFAASTSRRKGEIASLFNHPRIVRTLGHGLTTKGEQFVVMEYLDGPGLNSLIIGRSKLLDGNRARADDAGRRVAPRRFTTPALSTATFAPATLSAPRMRRR